MEDLGAFASRFEGVVWVNELKFKCRCPTSNHPDGDPELSVLARLDGDQILVGCFGGVGDTAAAILEAIGLTEADLFINHINGKKPKPSSLQAWKVFIYRDIKDTLTRDSGQHPEFLASCTPEILYEGVMKDLRRGFDAGRYNPLPDISPAELEREVNLVTRVAIEDWVVANTTKKPAEEQALVPARARTLKEYREGYKELLDQQWPLEDTLCPGCVSLLTAKKGIGKSTLFRYLVVNALRGDPSLGRMSASNLRVLYLPLEAGGMPVLLGFEKAGLEDHPNFRIEDTIPAEYRTLDQRALWVKQLIEDHQPQLVIIDTLGRFSRLGGNDDYGGTTEIVGELEKIARVTNCHIIYSHHVGKNRPDDADLSGSALGSSGIESAAQAHIHLRRRARGLVTIEIGDMRVGKALPETVLSWNETDDSLELGDLWSNTNLQMLESTKVMVQAFLASAPPDEWYSAVATGKEVNTGRRWVSWALATLFKEGQLDRNGKGRRGSPYEFRSGTGVDHQKI